MESISAGGKLSGATMDIEEALKDTDVILIVVPSFAHKPIFNKMVPHLEDGQHVIIIPGNYGGLRLKKMMTDLGIKKRSPYPKRSHCHTHVGLLLTTPS